MINNKFKNYILFDCSSKFNIESTFNMNNLNVIFLNWNLKFFKFSNLYKFNPLKIYKNSLFSFFFSLEHILYFFKYNFCLFKFNLKILYFCYNNFFLNLNYFISVNLKLFSNIFFIYFFNLLLNIVFNLLYLFIFKLFYFLNMFLLKKK